MLDTQPHLEGATVRVRPMQTDDFDALYAVASDPELWALHPIWNRYQLPVFQQLFEESIASAGALVVVEKASGSIIGSSRYFVPEANAQRIEIGWSYLTRSHWGGGTNAEVKSLLLRHAFQNVDTVYFRVGAENWRSRRAMEKIGGLLTDAIEDIQLPDGRRVIHVIFEISKAGFADGPLNKVNS